MVPRHRICYCSYVHGQGKYAFNLIEYWCCEPVYKRTKYSVFFQSCGAVRPVGQPRLSLLCPKSLGSPVISIWFYLQHWHPQPYDHWRLKGEDFGKLYVQFGEMTAYTRLQRPQWYGLHVLGYLVFFPCHLPYLAMTHAQISPTTVWMRQEHGLSIYT